jgi:hypothetical protein
MRFELGDAQRPGESASPSGDLGPATCFFISYLSASYSQNDYRIPLGTSLVVHFITHRNVTHNTEILRPMEIISSVTTNPEEGHAEKILQVLLPISI